MNFKHFGAFIIAASFMLLLMANFCGESGRSMNFNYIENLKVKTKCIETLDLERAIGSKENNIFFIETNEDIAAFHPRLLCAFESAAVHNPDMRVCI